MYPYLTINNESNACVNRSSNPQELNLRAYTPCAFSDENSLFTINPKTLKNSTLLTFPTKTLSYHSNQTTTPPINAKQERKNKAINEHFHYTLGTINFSAVRPVPLKRFQFRIPLIPNEHLLPRSHI